MDLQQALAPTDEPAPGPWRAAALAAAFLAFLAAAASRGMAGLGVQVIEELGGAGRFAPLSALGPLLGLVVALAAGGLVVLALRLPWLALVLAAAPLVLVVPMGVGVPSGLLVLLGGICVAAAWRRPVAAVGATVAGLAAVLLGLVVSGPFGPLQQLLYTSGLVGAALWTGLLCGVLVVSLAVRLQLRGARTREEGLAARSAEVEQQSVVTAERARLARDLHDVVAHHVSLIAVRAETAPYTHPGLAADARAVLAEIASDARRALDELRGVLGILGRSAGEDRLPQPSWSDIPGLVERATSSGERVAVGGDVGAEVDPTVGYVAYRVVQEGLTNARKHAPGAPVDVHLERTSHLAVVSVTTTGTTGRDVGVEETAPLAAVKASGATAPSDPGAGQGLVGMRERVESLGGRLVAGRRDGGFTVEATLPLTPGTRL